MFAETDFVKAVVERLFRHRRSFYSEWIIENILSTKEMKQENFTATNMCNESLYASFYSYAWQMSRLADYPCLVFMHGYGSNRLECAGVLRILPDSYVACSFDFSGSGKSSGNKTTFGMKEKHDIHCILEHLRGMGCCKFVLWGRSMGATSALLYCHQYQPKDVMLVVSDSAFYSFENVATEIASKNFPVPTLVTSLILESVKANCKSMRDNPFQIVLQRLKITVAVLLVYSENDSVVNCSNSQLIIEHLTGNFEKLIIDQNHNTTRSETTLNKIFIFLKKYASRDKKNLTAHLLEVPHTVEHHSKKTHFLETTLKESRKKRNAEAPHTCHDLNQHRRGVTISKWDTKEHIPSREKLLLHSLRFESPVGGERKAGKLSLAKSALQLQEHRAKTKPVRMGHGVLRKEIEELMLGVVDMPFTLSKEKYL